MPYWESNHGQSLVGSNVALPPAGREAIAFLASRQTSNQPGKAVILAAPPTAEALAPSVADVTIDW